jgi:hypothetical protein
MSVILVCLPPAGVKAHRTNSICTLNIYKSKHTVSLSLECASHVPHSSPSHDLPTPFGNLVGAVLLRSLAHVP